MSNQFAGMTKKTALSFNTDMLKIPGSYETVLEGLSNIESNAQNDLGNGISMTFRITEAADDKMIGRTYRISYFEFAGNFGTKDERRERYLQNVKSLVCDITGLPALDVDGEACGEVFSPAGNEKLKGVKLLIVCVEKQQKRDPTKFSYPVTVTKL